MNETPKPAGAFATLWDSVMALFGRSKLLVKELEDQQTPADDTVLGKVGLITARVAPGRAGEVRLPIRGGSEDFIACVDANEAPLEINAPAEVVSFLAPRTVYVRSTDKAAQMT